MCLLSLQEGMLRRSSTAVSVMCVSSTINTGGTAIIDRNDVLIYDSLYNVVDENTIKLLGRLFSRKIRGKKMQCLQKQSGSKDYGLFGSVSTSLAHCVDPTKIQFNNQT